MGDLQVLDCGSNGEIPLSGLIGPSHWAQAERVAKKIISKVQPTSVSEERRREVIDYVQRLIRTRLGCEVFPYGSVPLKTYLPDGDIDLTAFAGVNNEDSLPANIASVLEREEKNEAAEFVVKDVQLIRAEVKLVKCIVQNIVVDISINQIGGLCTLCFLEQVDRLIAKDHLFKRSIILIKAWCYYESRILGAHHALISTYALETLVLYIFHLFHSMLDGPLAVLYKFLDYFSKFDWKNFCISLTGPVHVSSLPEIIAETPENGGKGLLLTGDFLRNCFDMFHVPSRGGETNLRTFQKKHLNIVDPLKENNNLGRSVSEGNFYRIMSAFKYGVSKLGQILLQPEDNITIDLHNFFMNTLERHGHGERPDVQDSDGRVTSTDVGSRFFTENGNHNYASNGNGSMLNLEEVGDRIQGLSISSGIPINTASGPAEIVSTKGFPYHAPHLFFSNSHVHDEISFKESQASAEAISINQEAKSSGSPKSTHSLPDLTGDYESHINCLRYGRWWCEYGAGIPILPVPLMLPHVQMKMPYEVMLHPPHFKPNGYSHANVNDVIQNSAFYGMNAMVIPPGLAVGLEDIPKPRGTGTYFPHTNQPRQGFRPYPGKSRSHPARSPRNNMRSPTFSETGNHDRNSFGSGQSDSPSSKHGNSDVLHSFSPRGKGHSIANGLVALPQGSIENGSRDHLKIPSLERSKQQKHPSSSSPNSNPVFKPVFSRDNRFSMRSVYRLKDEGDFPPLSNKGDPVLE